MKEFSCELEALVLWTRAVLFAAFLSLVVLVILRFF
jgi:hypothetical protein